MSNNRSYTVLPGCAAPEKVLFKANSTLDRFFRQFDELTRPMSLKCILGVTIVYLCFNIFHLIILTRPAMKTLTVSREMTLIAICGVLVGILGVIKSIYEVADHHLNCVHSYLYFELVLIYFILFQLLNQLILWLIVYITFLRCAVILDVRYGMETAVLKKAMRVFIYVLFAVFILVHLARSYFHRIVPVHDKRRILDAMTGKTCKAENVYTLESFAGNCLRRILLSVSGSTSLVIPVCIMFLLSIFLVFQLRTSHEAIATSSSEPTHRHTNTAYSLVLFLCFYVLAELPYFVLFTIGITNPADFEQLDEYVYSQVDIFIYTNMCLGILVYCLMSSQYRATVRATFWKNATVVVEYKNSNPTS